MTVSNMHNWTATTAISQHQQAALLQGEILLQTRSHSAWGGACTATMYLPMARAQVWQQVTDYPRWVHYFPDVIKSEVLHRGDGLTQSGKHLYQMARKAFLMFTAEVEIYLGVFEVLQQQIQFRMEKGSFMDFTADLKLQDCDRGTLLTYTGSCNPYLHINLRTNNFLPAFMHLNDNLGRARCLCTVRWESPNQLDWQQSHNLIVPESWDGQKARIWLLFLV